MKKAFSSILLIFFSAMMLIHCAYADITESLIYDEADNTWAAGDEDLTDLVSVMKRECAKSSLIKGTYCKSVEKLPEFVNSAVSADKKKNPGALCGLPLGLWW